MRSLPACLKPPTNYAPYAKELGGGDAQALVLADKARKPAVTALDFANYRVVAFATHGLVAGDITGLAEPALVLTPPPGPWVRRAQQLIIREISLGVLSGQPLVAKQLMAGIVHRVQRLRDSGIAAIIDVSPAAAATAASIMIPRVAQRSRQDRRYTEERLAAAT